MSLDTLLEAAEFIEWSAHTKPRDDGSPEVEIIRFIKTETLADGDDGNSSLDDSIESQRGFGDESKEKRRAGGAGTRETHNKLEKNRRAHLKECFDLLKAQMPFLEDKKTSNLSILRGALKFVQNLKRKDKELERDLHKLASDKSKLREKIAKLKVDLAMLNMDVDLTKWMPIQEQETNSTSTASGAGSPIISDNEEDRVTRFHKKHKNSTKDKCCTSQLPMIKNIPVKIIQPSPVLPPVTTLMAPCGATSTKATHIRAPVTQLLHQTLSKRQALQKQREQLTVTQAPTLSSQSVVAPSVINQLLRQQLSFPVGASPSVGTLLSSAMNIPGTSCNKGYKSNNIQTTTTTTTMAIPKTNMVTYTTSATNSSQRILPVTTIPGLSNISTLSALSQLTAVAGLGNPTPFSSSSLSSINVPNKATQMITTIVTPSITSLASMSAIKPILATTQATHLMSGQLALNPLLTQFPRNNTLLAGMTSQDGSPTGQPHLYSLAQMGAVTPMAVMPQGLQMAGLTANQFNSIMSPHQLFKQFPILQQMQQGQVISQPIVKPVVMVSVPSVVTSGASTLSLNIITTS